MSPIRVALIGLSASAKTGWAAGAHLPYLLSDKGRSRYTIAALCNSSKAAAENAIRSYDLPSATKAYGSPAEVAADPDIDLVVVTTRVDVHYDVIKPSLEAGKAAFVEWPLAENPSRAAELADLAKARNVRTMVGVQGRVSPLIVKVANLLKSGVIGTVMSSDVRIFHSLIPRKGLPEGLAYFTDSKVGGNNVAIAFAHTIDFVHSVLGEYASSSTHAQILQEEVTIFGEKGDYKLETNVPDVVLMGGILQGSPTVRPGATLSITYRRDPPPFPGDPAFVWSIFGEKGQIRFTSPDGPFLQSEAYADGTPVSIEVSDGDKVSKIDWQWEDWQEPLAPRGRNVAELYERFARGKEHPTFDDAVVRHRQIEGVFEDFRKRTRAE